MVEAWRLVNARYADDPLSGEGSAKFGGRWNSKGGRMVYCSSALSLAALELLVHLDPMVPIKFVAFKVQFDSRLVERLPVSELPHDWQEHPAPPSTREIGDQWLQESRSAVLQVPSVVVPDEWNFLINPLHRDFTRIRLGERQPFAFDPRLLKRS